MSELSGAEEAIKKALRTFTSSVHVDETGVSIAGKRRWLHGASDQERTYFFPHKKEEKKRWMRPIFYRTSKVYCATTIRNPIIGILIAHMHCVTRINC
jgi:hypothetical protein